MAHLFVQRAESDDSSDARGWEVQPLDGAAFDLFGRSADPPALQIHSAGQPPGATRAEECLGHLLQAGAKDQAAWVLLASASAVATRNGRPVLLGVAVLSDRDRVMIESERSETPFVFYFSTESPPRIEAFPGPEGAICPRCKTALRRDEPAVRCPRCGLWYHQVEAADTQGERRPRPCWTYLERCANCGASTALDGKPAWTPEERSTC